MGYVAVAAAAVLWAVSGAFARSLIDRGASVVELTQARAWVTALALGAWVLLRKPAGPRPGRVPGWLVVAFGLSIAAVNVSYYLSLARLPVAVAIVIQYTAPGLVVAWKAAATRRAPSARVLVALAAAFAGVVLLAGLGGGELRLPADGLALSVAAAVAFAAYMVIGERVGRALGPVVSVFRAFVVASIFWLAVQATRGVPETLTDPRFIPGALFLAVAATIAPFTLFVWGLGRVEASRAAIVSTLEPVTAALVAWVWLGQSLSTPQLAGAALVIAGIGVVQSDRPPSPDVLAERAAGS